ncbi:hypothetical protein ANN_25832 [Periplaneta americana]|uniref:Uncharacterized protein n=1 Tax=Periplaneta americana TaxID=6978 RepID=A0ABQ8S4N1_PERAM|nr:hypothetical protein ANN_25832 [Periplaneta americana]
MPSTWPGIEAATLGIEGQRYTNSPQPGRRVPLKLYHKLALLCTDAWPNKVHELRREGGWRDFINSVGRLKKQESATLLAIRPVVSSALSFLHDRGVVASQRKSDQRKMQRKILGVTLKDKLPYDSLQKLANTADAAGRAMMMKWKWGGACGKNGPTCETHASEEGTREDHDSDGRICL